MTGISLPPPQSLHNWYDLKAGFHGMIYQEAILKLDPGLAILLLHLFCFFEGRYFATNSGYQQTSSNYSQIFIPTTVSDMHLGGGGELVVGISAGSPLKHHFECYGRQFILKFNSIHCLWKIHNDDINCIYVKNIPSFTLNMGRVIRKRLPVSYLTVPKREKQCLMIWT